MANIKQLDVKLTIKVGLGDINAPEKVIEQLKELANKQQELNGDDLTHTEALDWLNVNIHSDDACEWVYEVEEIS